MDRWDRKVPLASRARSGRRVRRVIPGCQGVQPVPLGQQDRLVRLGLRGRRDHKATMARPFLAPEFG
jgi:hypothetical protein